MWCFFQLDLAIKNALFFAQAGRRKHGRATPNPTDSFSKWFGTIVPASIPDSTAWWRRQSRELGAICDDTECGLMQSMVTITRAWGSAGAFFVCLCTLHFPNMSCIVVIFLPVALAQQSLCRNPCHRSPRAFRKANRNRAAGIFIHPGTEEGFTQRFRETLAGACFEFPEARVAYQKSVFTSRASHTSWNC